MGNDLLWINRTKAVAQVTAEKPASTRYQYRFPRKMAHGCYLAGLSELDRFLIVDIVPIAQQR